MHILYGISLVPKGTATVLRLVPTDEVILLSHKLMDTYIIYFCFKQIQNRNDNHFLEGQIPT